MLGREKGGNTWVPRPQRAASLLRLLFLTRASDTLLNVFLAIAVDNLANAQELTKVEPQGAPGTVNHLCTRAGQPGGGQQCRHTECRSLLPDSRRP